MLFKRFYDTILFMPILEVNNLKKSYDSFEALKGISFVIEKGEILGFLGPNGAGKTTTIQILLQIITPEAGEVKLFGMDAFKNRETVLQRMNFTSAYVYLFGSLTVWENLKVFAMLYGIQGTERISKLLKEFEAEDLKGKKAVTLSSGQLTRVMVVKALLNNPELLLLDEPTSSLDPDIAEKMREILKEIHRTRNISMLYTSHNMAEIEKMCSRVIFLSSGEIVANDTPEKLTRLIPNHQLRVTFEGEPKDAAVFLEKHNIRGKVSDHTLHIIAENEEIPAILGKLYGAGYKIRDIDIEEPDLEDVFLKIARESSAKK